MFFLTEESSYSFCYIQHEDILTEKSKWGGSRSSNVAMWNGLPETKVHKPDRAQLSLQSPGEAQGVPTGPQYFHAVLRRGLPAHPGPSSHSIRPN